MGSTLSLPILALAAILQASIVPQFSILGGRPDLVFLLVVSWALNAPLGEGLVWAFIGGVLQDLMSAAPTGTSVIGLVLIVFALDVLRQQVYRVGLITLMWVALVGTMVQQIVVMIVLSLSGFGIPFVNNFSYVVLPTVFYNFVLIFPVYFVARQIQKRVAGRARFFS